MNSQSLTAKNRFIKRINQNRFIKRTNQNNSNFNNLIKINKIYIRGYWSWNIHNDICAICRNYIFEPSINSSCQDCNAVVGTCGHAYHYECISSWVRTKKNCPLCNCKWDFKKTNKITKNTYNDNTNESYANANNSEESMSNE